jgi:hypothetical protein
MDVSDLKFMLCDLENSLENLCERIREGNYATQILQPLSFGYSSEENGFVAPQTFATLKGQEAVDGACKIIMGYYRTTGQPKLSVHRAPGCIHVSESCVEIVDEINSKKDAIKRALISLPRRAKTALAKSAAPGIVLKELYRHIHLVQNPIKINPSWIVSGSSTSLASADDIASLIIEKIAEVKNENGYATPFQTDLEKIKVFPATHQFHIKRQTPPHIRYNVKIANSWKPIPAHLPLLYVANAEPSYKPIGDVDNIRDINRSSPADNLYLIKWLGILK